MSRKEEFRILVTSDLHLGYMQRDEHAGNDSFDTLEEILEIANRKEVDLILIAGDLFHEISPKTHTFRKCIRILKRYLGGSSVPSFEAISPDGKSVLNIENPHFKTPIFAIHGCHDKPLTNQNCSALDVLCSNQMISYIGKHDPSQSIHIKPIILTKGDTQVALYALSHIPEHHLKSSNCTANEKKIFLQRPNDANVFNLMVLHQSVDGVAGIMEDMVPDFMQFVIWGHEHSCNIEPKAMGSTFLCQPGSTIRTCFNDGEFKDKHVAVLSIKDTKFKFEKIRLQSVRPFLHEKLFLEIPPEGEVDCEAQSKKSLDAAVETIDSLLERSKIMYAHRKIPNVLLEVHHYIWQQQFDIIGLGLDYKQKIANYKTMITFVKVGKPQIKEENGGNAKSQSTFRVTYQKTLFDYIKDEFDKPNGQQLEVLSLDDLGMALKKFVVGNCASAFDDAMDATIKRILEARSKRGLTVEEMQQEIAEIIQSSKDIRKGLEKVEDKGKRLLYIKDE